MDSNKGKVIVGLSAITLSYLGFCIRKSMSKSKFSVESRVPQTLKSDLEPNWMSQTQYGFDVRSKNADK